MSNADFKKKKLETVTVTELANCAGISRSSFYTHYKDKYQLVEKYEKSLFINIKHILKKNNGDSYVTLLQSLNFINENKIYLSLLSLNGSDGIQQLILYRLKVLIAEYFIYNKKNQTKCMHSLSKNRYLSTYYASAIMGVIQEWIRHGNSESPEDIANTIYSLIKRVDKGH